MKELLSDIDALLAELEDYAHGKDGDDITKMRARIAEEIKNQSQQTDGGELPDFLYSYEGEIFIAYYSGAVVTEEWNNWKKRNCR